MDDGTRWGGGSHSMHLLQIGQMQSRSREEFLIAGNMNIRTTPHSSLSIMGLVDAVGTLCCGAEEFSLGTLICGQF